MFGPNFLFGLLFLWFFIGLLDLFGSWYLYLFLLLLLSFNAIVAGDFLLFNWFNLHSTQLHFYFLCEHCLVLLNDWRSVVNVFVIGCDYTSFFKVLESSAVSSFFHIEKLFSVPCIQINGLDEGINNSVLSMFASAVETEMNAEMNGRPFRIFLFAIETNLNRKDTTLLELIVLI